MKRYNHFNTETELPMFKHVQMEQDRQKVKPVKNKSEAKAATRPRPKRSGQSRRYVGSWAEDAPKEGMG